MKFTETRLNPLHSIHDLKTYAQCVLRRKFTHIPHIALKCKATLTLIQTNDLLYRLFFVYPYDQVK
jgi:hypothetical protein